MRKSKPRVKFLARCLLWLSLMPLACACHPEPANAPERPAK